MTGVGAKKDLHPVNGQENGGASTGREQTPTPSAAMTAFDDKCDREQSKLFLVLSKLLKDDMKDLLESGTEADIVVPFKEGKLSCHRCIINARLPELWSSVLSRKDVRVHVQDFVPMQTLQQILRFIYLEDDLSPILEQVQQLIRACHNITETKSAEDSAESSTSNSPDIQDANNVTNGVSEVNCNQTNTDIDRKQETQAFCDVTCPDTDNKNNEACSVSSPVDDVTMVTKAETQIDNDSYQDAYCSLGKDLLGLYHAQTHSNVKVKVRDTSLALHRCVLYARSPYFRAMLGGQWRESAAREINLEGINTEAMKKALVYMYGGMPALSADGANVMELVTIADMYGLDGLKLMISYSFKKNCHFFHKPCNECVPSVVSCLPVAHMFGLDEFYEKALRWCSKHISRVWAAKPFAGLPSEIQDACLHSAINNINNDSVVAMVMECDKLAGSLTNVRWSEPVTAMASQLMDGCINHLKNNFVDFSKTAKFLSLGKTMALGLGFLNDIFSRAIITMPTGKACTTYARVHGLRKESETEKCSWTEDFKQLIRGLEEKCEHFLRLYINQLINTDDWNKVLSQELQDKIKEGAWYVCVGDSRRMRGPPRVLGYQSHQESATKESNPTPKSARPKNPVALGSHRPKQPQRDTCIPANKTSKGSTSKTTKALSSSQIPTVTAKVKSTATKQSSLPRPRKSMKCRTAAEPKTGPHAKLFKTVMQEGEPVNASSLDDLQPARPPTIKPVVRKSSTSACSTSPDSRSRISSTSSMGAPASPQGFCMAQNAGHLKCIRLETMSNMSFPSNAATISENSSLSTPSSDFGGSDGVSQTSGSDVFCSPEKELQPMGGPEVLEAEPMGGPGALKPELMYGFGTRQGHTMVESVATVVQPTIREIMSEREGIRFIVGCILTLRWLFSFPDQ